MENGNIAYCSRCDKYVKPDPGFECPICESSLRFEKEIPVVLPKAVTEPVMETEPEVLEETPVETEVEEVEVVAETDEVVDIEDLLAKG